MIFKNTSILFFSLFFVSCISGQKKNKTTNKSIKSTQVKQHESIKKNKKKVGINTYEKALERTKKYAFSLPFDLNYIRNKGLPDKKYLAEYLGLFLKLNKAYHTNQFKQETQIELKTIINLINQPDFHNMASVNDKLFKKNSMSYMRIMWLLDQLNYDISLYKAEFDKIKNRMDNHMKLRGEWQRAVFDKYYDYFSLEKPTELKYAKKLKGPIAYQKNIEYYNRNNAYILTHFIFAAYDYGNSFSQKRFDKKDLEYLKNILPQIISVYEAKNNDDIVGELLTCQVMLGNTNSNAFKQSFNRLLYRQNQDGSFGAYERARKKIGDDIEFRAYLHTTLVDIELFIEDAYRKNKPIKS